MINLARQLSKKPGAVQGEAMEQHDQLTGWRAGGERVKGQPAGREPERFDHVIWVTEAVGQSAGSPGPYRRTTARAQQERHSPQSGNRTTTGLDGGPSLLVRSLNVATTLATQALIPGTIGRV
jgi:hypothetical protein